MDAPLRGCNRTTGCHRDGSSVAHAPSAPDWVIGWAGLLALGSLSDLAFPGATQWRFQIGLADYSCGGSTGFDRFPFSPRKAPNTLRLTLLTDLSRQSHRAEHTRLNLSSKWGASVSQRWVAKAVDYGADARLSGRKRSHYRQKRPTRRATCSGSPPDRQWLGVL